MDRGLLAEFATAEAMVTAAARLRRDGYRRLDTYSPYPLTGAEEALGLRRSRLPVAVFLAGLAGGVLAYLIQWYPNAVAYPLNVGFRPPHAWPAFVPITFELTVLSAAFGAVLAFLAVCRLPKLWDPLFEVEGFERVTLDRFFVGVDARDPRFDAHRSARELEEAGALRVVPFGGAP